MLSEPRGYRERAWAPPQSSVLPSSQKLDGERRLLAKAARLARRGRYQSAEHLLAGMTVDGPLGPSVLDLKAKVFAQQGRFLEAEDCWMKALRQSPGNQAFRRALDYLAGHHRLAPPLWWLLAGLLLGLLISIFVVSVAHPMSGVP